MPTEGDNRSVQSHALKPDDTDVGECGSSACLRGREKSYACHQTQTCSNLAGFPLHSLISVIHIWQQTDHHQRLWYMLPMYAMLTLKWSYFLFFLIGRSIDIWFLTPSHPRGSYRSDWFIRDWFVRQFTEQLRLYTILPVMLLFNNSEHLNNPKITLQTNSWGCPKLRNQHQHLSHLLTS